MTDHDPSLPPATDLPSPIDLATSTLSKFIEDIAPMLLVGVGQLLIGLAAVVIVVPLAFGCLCAVGMGGTFGGAALDALVDADGGLAATGTGLSMILSYALFALVLVLGMAILTGPFAGSLMRGLDRHLAGGEQVNLGDLFSSAWDQPVKDIGSTLLFALAISLGLPFCYVGALVPAFFLMFFNYACELDGLSLPAAARRSIQAVLARPTWALAAFALGAVFAIVGGNIPVLGPVAALLFSVRVYRAMFPRPAIA